MIATTTIKKRIAKISSSSSSSSGNSISVAIFISVSYYVYGLNSNTKKKSIGQFLYDSSIKILYDGKEIFTETNDTCWNEEWKFFSNSFIHSLNQRIDGKEIVFIKTYISRLCCYSLIHSFSLLDRKLITLERETHHTHTYTQESIELWRYLQIDSYNKNKQQRQQQSDRITKSSISI